MRQITPLLFLLLCIAGCNCLPVPTSDSSPPSAGLVIEWRDIQGQTQSQTFSQLDSDVTITASKNHVIAVLYLGLDNQGMRSIHLKYGMFYSSGTSVTRPLLVPIEVVSSYPRKTLTGAENFEPDGQAWHYTFTTESKNWLDLTTRSATIKVNTQ